MSDYINLLVRIAHIICNHPVALGTGFIELTLIDMKLLRRLNAGSMGLGNVGILSQDYTALQLKPRRPRTETYVTSNFKLIYALVIEPRVLPQ
jgi:hypothetical protein